MCVVCHAEHRNRAGHLTYKELSSPLPHACPSYSIAIVVLVSELVLGLPTYGATVRDNEHELITSTRNIWEDILPGFECATDF